MGFGSGIFKLFSRRKEGPGFYSVEDYYEQFFTPKTLSALEMVLSGNGKTQVQSKMPIDFKLVPFNSTVKSVRKTHGPPKFRIDNNVNLPGHEILFYKFIIGGIKSIVQLHFINREFFMGQFIFYETPILKFQEIKNLVIKKYEGDNSINFNESVLVDNFGNKIEIQEVVYGTITYIAGNSKVYQIIADTQNSRNRKKTEEDQGSISDLFDRL